ncbi:MAG: Sec-independent protein translocase protein TatA [Desulfovibrio sp.]
MFGKIGITQLLVLFGIFVLFFGYKKIPELGKNLGKGIREWRKAVTESDAIDITPEAEPAREKVAERPARKGVFRQARRATHR